MTNSRCALPVAFFLILVACSQPPADQSAAQGPTPAPLLTADEMAKVLLDKAMVWKFESKPGVRVKKIRFQLVEDGQTSDRMSLQTGADPTITKIIVVIQDMGNNKRLVKFYHEGASGSALGTADAWFSKPLTTSGATVQTAARPIALGTTTLLEGWTEVPVSGKSYASDSAPCRINLIIE